MSHCFQELFSFKKINDGNQNFNILFIAFPEQLSSAQWLKN